MLMIYLWKFSNTLKQKNVFESTYRFVKFFFKQKIVKTLSVNLKTFRKKKLSQHQQFSHLYWTKCLKKNYSFLGMPWVLFFFVYKNKIDLKSLFQKIFQCFLSTYSVKSAFQKIFQCFSWTYSVSPNSDDVVWMWYVWKVSGDDVSSLTTKRWHRSSLKFVPETTSGPWVSVFEVFQFFYI